MTNKMTSHPDLTTLMSFSAGSLSEALSAVTATHVADCAQCRAELKRMDAIGAALLTGLPGNGSFSRSQAASAADIVMTKPSARVHPKQTALPAMLAERYGIDAATFNDIPWRRLGLGVWHYPLPLSGLEGGDLRLLKISPGRKMPEHGHGGAELTLVLDGAYSDASGTYAAGDIQDVDDDTEHRPVANAESGCICLIGSEHPARFTGLLGRIVQPFVRI